MASLTSVLCRSLRFRFCDFEVMMWFASECDRLTLPVAVNLKRFFAPLWDFNLGMMTTRRSKHASAAQKSPCLHLANPQPPLMLSGVLATSRSPTL
jgi:hypothetical protein